MTDAHVCFAHDDIYAQWHAQPRVIVLGFRPHTRLTGETARPLFQFLECCAAGRDTWFMLGDLANLTDVDADTRRQGREFLRGHAAQMRFGAYGANIIIRTMFGFFVSGAGMRGCICATRDEALSWLGISGVDRAA